LSQQGLHNLSFLSMDLMHRHLNSVIDVYDMMGQIERINKKGQNIIN